MSHGKLRTETDCLNCGAQINGRYCSQCGQENIEPKQTLRHLLTHFFNDVTHFDSRFWSTLKPLLIKPGFLSEEYIKGRRVKYIDPVRMYLFISAAFFVLFFTIREEHKTITKENNPVLVRIIDSMRAHRDREHVKDISDTFINEKQIFVLSLDDAFRHGYKHYDSVEKTYPDLAKTNTIGKYINRKMVPIWSVYDQDPYNFFPTVFEKFRHSYSKVFFISLPFFSLFLYLLYFRRRKTYFYVAHAIFSLHCYCVAFIVLLFIQLLNNKYYSMNQEILGYVIIGIMIGSFIYLYKAMRRFYQQGRIKTAIKTILLSATTFVLILVIISSLLVNSFFSMAA